MKQKIAMQSAMQLQNFSNLTLLYCASDDSPWSDENEFGLLDEIFWFTVTR